MAEYRIPVQMDIIGTGVDEAAARCGQCTVFGRGAGVQRILQRRG
jgi:hypothetical protein